MPPVAIGVDVGGTKTHLRVEHGPELLADAVVPTRSWWRSGTPIDHPGNPLALLRALPGLPPEPAALVVGAHGIDSSSVALRMAHELSEHFAGPVRVLNDAALVGPAAGYLGTVITVIAGTGSIVLSMAADGTATRHGGHGYLLGDEGSAPALVRDLARELLRSADRGRPDPIALAHLADAARVPDAPDRVHDLAAALHHRPTITEWGRLAPAVFTAAAAGSPLAARVIGQHAAELAELVGLQLAAGTVPEAVVLAGGVVTAQPELSAAIAARIHLHHPELPVVLLDQPPVAGAIVLARRELAGARTTTGSAQPAAEPSQPIAQPSAQTEGNRP